MVATVLMFVLFVSLVYTLVEGSTKINKRRSLEENDCFPCYLAKPEIMSENGSEYDEESSPPLCLHQRSNRGYRENFRITLSSAFLAKHANIIDSGGAHFCIPGGYISPAAENDLSFIIVPDERLIRLRQSAADYNNNNSCVNSDHEGRCQGHHGQRLLENKEVRIGKKKILAVRVTSIFDEIPEESVEEIESAIFGVDGLSNGGFGVTFDPKASVVDQYKAISHNQLILSPAIGDNINNGVAEVVIAQRVNESSIDEGLGLNILAKTEALVGPLDEVADFIVFCIPDGSLAGNTLQWTAYTFIYDPYSYYQQSSCTKLSFVMHELGHSIGFRHSGIGSDEYADESGYMGYAIKRYGVPRKAFNAHKHWFSGWFSDRKLTVNPVETGSLKLRLVPFVEYSRPDIKDDDVVLLNVANLYIQFNVAVGYNAETPKEYREKVIITEADHPTHVSKHIAALSKGESLAHDLFDSRYKLIIEFCEIAGSSFEYATISLHIDDGIQVSSCSKTTPDRPPSATGTPVSIQDGTAKNGQSTKIAMSVVAVVVFLAIGIWLAVHYLKSKQQEDKGGEEMPTSGSDSSAEDSNCDDDPPSKPWFPGAALCWKTRNRSPRKGIEEVNCNNDSPPKSSLKQDSKEGKENSTLKSLFTGGNNSKSENIDENLPRSAKGIGLGSSDLLSWLRNIAQLDKFKSKQKRLNDLTLDNMEKCSTLDSPAKSDDDGSDGDEKEFQLKSWLPGNLYGRSTPKQFLAKNTADELRLASKAFPTENVETPIAVKRDEGLTKKHNAVLSKPSLNRSQSDSHELERKRIPPKHSTSTDGCRRAYPTQLSHSDSYCKPKDSVEHSALATKVRPLKNPYISGKSRSPDNIHTLKPSRNGNQPDIRFLNIKRPPPKRSHSADEHTKSRERVLNGKGLGLTSSNGDEPKRMPFSGSKSQIISPRRTPTRSHPSKDDKFSLIRLKKAISVPNLICANGKISSKNKTAKSPPKRSKSAERHCEQRAPPKRTFSENVHNSKTHRKISSRNDDTRAPPKRTKSAENHRERRPPPKRTNSENVRGKRPDSVKPLQNIGYTDLKSRSRIDDARAPPKRTKSAEGNRKRGAPPKSAKYAENVHGNIPNNVPPQQSISRTDSKIRNKGTRSPPKRTKAADGFRQQRASPQKPSSESSRMRGPDYGILPEQGNCRTGHKTSSRNMSKSPPKRTKSAEGYRERRTPPKRTHSAEGTCERKERRHGTRKEKRQSP